MNREICGQCGGELSKDNEIKDKPWSINDSGYSWLSTAPLVHALYSVTSENPVHPIVLREAGEAIEGLLQERQNLIDGVVEYLSHLYSSCSASELTDATERLRDMACPNYNWAHITAQLPGKRIKNFRKG